MSAFDAKDLDGGRRGNPRATPQGQWPRFQDSAKTGKTARCKSTQGKEVVQSVDPWNRRKLRKDRDLVSEGVPDAPGASGGTW